MYVALSAVSVLMLLIMIFRGGLLAPLIGLVVNAILAVNSADIEYQVSVWVAGSWEHTTVHYTSAWPLMYFWLLLFVVSLLGTFSSVLKMFDERRRRREWDEVFRI